MNHKQKLLEKIESKSAVVGIVGLGYVGLPLGLEFVSKGFNVIGFDVDKRKIPLLKSGKTYIKHIDETRIKNAVDSKLFDATSDFTKLPDCDAVIICVPTPLDEHREPDMRFINETAKTIQKHLRKGQLVTLESTTYPGTTEEILLPMFENAPKEQKSFSVHLGETALDSENVTVVKFICCEDFFFAFSPERYDPSNTDSIPPTFP